MGGASIWHWIVVGVIIMLLFGRGKVSDLMGDVAKGIKAFKKGMADDEQAPTTTAQVPHAQVPPVQVPLMAFSYSAGNWIIRRTVWLFADYKVSGKERVPRSGPLIVVANHQSNMDPPILAASVPRRLKFPAKAELFERGWASSPSPRARSLCFPKGHAHLVACAGQDAESQPSRPVPAPRCCRWV